MRSGRVNQVLALALLLTGCAQPNTATTTVKSTAGCGKFPDQSGRRYSRHAAFCALQFRRRLFSPYS